MSYTNEHVEGETDVSVMVRAISDGTKYQLGIEATNLLKLKDNLPATLIQFNEMYGDYLIVGWNYGGEIVHESSFSSKSTEDKESLAAGLWYVDSRHIAYVNWKAHCTASMFTKRII